MKRKNAWLLFGILLLLILAGVVLIFYFQSTKNAHLDIKDTVTIANWNLKILGDTKEEKPEIMNKYAEVISNFDIVFVQEIRDADGSAFVRLCSMLKDYQCNVSSRAGRSSNKEQYGIIYQKDIHLIYMYDYNPDFLDRWERPPIRALFDVKGYDFTVYNIHTKPEDTPKELSNLERLVEGELSTKMITGNVIIIGDMNADCGYYKKRVNFLNWTWVIKDDDDTTVGSSDCAYDRIIMDKDAYAEFVEYGIYRSNITEALSDHYPVWVRIKNSENIVKSILG